MKNTLPVFSLLFLMACGASDQETATDYKTLTFSIDTVMVDPGQEIINLKGNLWISDISKDKKYLFNWDQDNSILEKINLDELRLEEKLVFEKEGPNGVGSYIAWISLLGEDQILFANFQDMGLFGFNKEKSKTYTLKGQEFEGDSLEQYESFNRRAIITNDGNDIYGILGNWTSKIHTLAKVDFKNKTLKKHTLPGYEKLEDYSVMLQTGQMTMISAADQKIQEVEGKLILSNSVFNTLLVYDLEMDSLYKIEYNNILTKNSKTGKYQKEVESEAEFQRIMTDINAEINFLAPVWDPQNKKFYRFSYENIPVDVPLEEGERGKSRVFLTVLDQEFKILGEALVSELQEYPNIHFVKDGKIWIAKNIEDELGFVRLSF